MANTGVSHEEVKSICSNLEKSPSKDNMKSSPIYGGGDKGHGAGAVGTAGFKAPPSKTGPKKNKKDPYTHGH